jgi:hypothetical protein
MATATVALVGWQLKEMIMKNTVAILWYSKNLVGEYGWNLVRKITWAEYLVYSKQVSGEGSNWKAEII